MTTLLLPLILMSAGGGQAPSPPPEPPAEEARHHHSDQNDDATTHHGFDDVERWVERFDDPERVTWQKPDEVIAALKLSPGMNVADIGAGTGYFNARFAKAVGPEGKVYPADIEPAMVDYMKKRAVREETPNVLPILAAPDDPKLPEAAIDLVIIVDTYHHIDDRLKYFERLKRCLRPGGRVAVIDFHKRELPVGPPPEHKLAREYVVEEFEGGGWRLAAEHGFLPYQYFLIFEPR